MDADTPSVSQFQTVRSNTCTHLHSAGLQEKEQKRKHSWLDTPSTNNILHTPSLDWAV